MASQTSDPNAEPPLEAQEIVDLLHISIDEQLRASVATLPEERRLKVAQELANKCKHDKDLDKKLKDDRKRWRQEVEVLERAPRVSLAELEGYLRSCRASSTDLELPENEKELRELAMRMFNLVNILGNPDQPWSDRSLSSKEFETVRRQCLAKSVKGREDLKECSKYSMRPDSEQDFIFGSYRDFSHGFAEKLAPLLRRSIDEEFRGPLSVGPSDTGHRYQKWGQLYRYVVKESARERGAHEIDEATLEDKCDQAGTPVPKLDAQGRQVIYDEGHGGSKLEDFVKRAKERGVSDITSVEVGILRLYTDLMYRPWNNALRGLDYDYNEDDNQSLCDWATCLMVLCGALLKLSRATPDEKLEQALKNSNNTVYRGVLEDPDQGPRRKLPLSFYSHGYPNPGGAEPAIMSVTPDEWTAYEYSGGWDAKGTILKISYGPEARGADLRFLSVYPREMEVALPPLTFLKVDPDSVRDRGHNKRIIECSLIVNATRLWMDSVVEGFDHLPKKMQLLRTESSASADAFYRYALKKFPEFIDPWRAKVLDDPVYFADGGPRYERADLASVRENKKAAESSTSKQDSPLPAVGSIGHPFEGPSEARAREAFELLDSEAPFPDGVKFKLDLALRYKIRAVREQHNADTKLLLKKRDRDKAEKQKELERDIQQVDRLGHVFRSLDAITSQIKAVHWDVPMFVVLGSESSGKSSLLERIAMIPIFPRGEKITTRMAIKIQLRRTADVDTPPEVSVVKWKEKDPVTGQPVEDPRFKKRTIMIVDGDYRIREVMDEVMKDTTNKQGGVSMDLMLVVNVSRPNVPSIDLVDLPGYVTKSYRDEPADFPENTQKLLRDFVDEFKSISIFLLVLKAEGEQPSQSKVFELIKELKVIPNTIGVLTHCDKINVSVRKPAAELHDILCGDDGALTPYGWIATCNRVVGTKKQKHGKEELQRLQKTAQEEITILDNQLQKMSKHVKINFRIQGQLGCNKVIELMNTAFIQHLRRHWAPKIVPSLLQLQDQLLLKNKALGLPAVRHALVGKPKEILVRKIVAGTQTLLGGRMRKLRRGFTESDVQGGDEEVASEARAGSAVPPPLSQFKSGNKRQSSVQRDAGAMQEAMLALLLETPKSVQATGLRWQRILERPKTGQLLEGGEYEDLAKTLASALQRADSTPSDIVEFDLTPDEWGKCNVDEKDLRVDQYIKVGRDFFQPAIREGEFKTLMDTVQQRAILFQPDDEDKGDFIDRGAASLWTLQSGYMHTLAERLLCAREEFADEVHRRLREDKEGVQPFGTLRLNRFERYIDSVYKQLKPGWSTVDNAAADGFVCNLSAQRDAMVHEMLMRHESLTSTLQLVADKLSADGQRDVWVERCSRERRDLFDSLRLPALAIVQITRILKVATQDSTREAAVRLDPSLEPATNSKLDMWRKDAVLLLCRLDSSSDLVEFEGASDALKDVRAMTEMFRQDREGDFFDHAQAELDVLRQMGELVEALGHEMDDTLELLRPTTSVAYVKAPVDAVRYIGLMQAAIQLFSLEVNLIVLVGMLCEGVSIDLVDVAYRVINALMRLGMDSGSLHTDVKELTAQIGSGLHSPVGVIEKYLRRWQGDVLSGVKTELQPVEGRALQAPDGEQAQLLKDFAPRAPHYVVSTFIGASVASSVELKRELMGAQEGEVMTAERLSDEDFSSAISSLSAEVFSWMGARQVQQNGGEPMKLAALLEPENVKTLLELLRKALHVTIAQTGLKDGLEMEAESPASATSCRPADQLDGSSGSSVAAETMGPRRLDETQVNNAVDNCKLFLIGPSSMWDSLLRSNSRLDASGGNESLRYTINSICDVLDLEIGARSRYFHSRDQSPAHIAWGLLMGISNPDLAA